MHMCIWVLDSDSDFFGVFGQIPLKYIFIRFSVVGRGLDGKILLLGAFLGLGFFRVDGQSVPHRVILFLKLNLHQFSDVCEVILSKSKT